MENKVEWFDIQYIPVDSLDSKNDGMVNVSETIYTLIHSINGDYNNDMCYEKIISISFKFLNTVR